MLKMYSISINPIKEPINPIEIPIIKNILTILLLDMPIVFKMPISLFFSFTNIINPEIMFKDATKIIKDKMINITFFSTLSALIKDLIKIFPRYRIKI